MRLFLCCFLCSLCIPFMAYAQQVNPAFTYLGQKPPTVQPKIFAPEIISKKGEYEFGSVFNKDATQFFYGVQLGGRTVICYSELKGNTWTTPITILSNPKYGFNDPFLSPDEQRLYFISQKALDGSGAKEDHDIWYVERQGNSWSEPINAGPNINSPSEEYYISFTKEGTMYFSSNKNQNHFDIYTSESKNGEFQEAIKLGPSINTTSYEADVFVDPNEKYVIFCATRSEGLGRGDLYISFKNPDGSWTKSINMGTTINTEGHELCPFVSKDGKYFFYTSNQDIYWVSTEVIEELRGK
ncbi:WD40-like Beta Propeller Repeat [Dokdonia pacifica]|uniref:WD40-like Beta Propeller Repeat n=2 Tax=Dokdonia pacifica TaxID=1627892 RepID=A0A238ZMA2_9FLAO|nr:WD40-like Beta Propeller Repeat [Dokdonia pacifica]